MSTKTVTISYQYGILIFRFLPIDHETNTYPWTKAEGLTKKMNNHECPGQGPLLHPSLLKNYGCECLIYNIIKFTLLIDITDKKCQCYKQNLDLLQIVISIKSGR